MVFIAKKTTKSIPVIPLLHDGFAAWLKKQPRQTQEWVKGAGFSALPGTLLLVPDAKGHPARVLLGTGQDETLYTYADLPKRLPAHAAGYYIDKKMTPWAATRAALGWAMGSYAFAQYKSTPPKTPAPLVWPEHADKKFVTAAATATMLVRDLVNTPCNDMGPAELAAAARKLGKGATVKVISGAQLKKEYPTIHAVGRASPQAPRLIDIHWGQAKHPKVTLVGKGVCFDTGGLNLKTGSSMDIMKKDMGGAAHVLGLAHMIIAHKLPIRLRVLIPAVENAVSGDSFRPGDILTTRKGITVEIGNTDAEGRLVLCDALAEACREKPKLIVDFATLTGAARVALGPDLPALFCNDDKIMEPLLNSARDVEDPMWPMPLWGGYNDMLHSPVADVNNAGAGGHAGAITAALFLQRFIDKGISWAHIDTYAWNASERPGRPKGGEALGMRAVYDLLARKFGKAQK